MNNNYSFNLSEKSSNTESYLKSLRDNGFVHLSGFFDGDHVDLLAERVLDGFTRPAIGGSFGYGKKDHFRRYLYPPLTLGKPVLNLVLNENLLNLVEQYMEGEPLIAELHIKRDNPLPYIHFPPHLDIFPGWQKVKSNKPVDHQDMKKKLGVGAIVYLEDCDSESSNFMYARGTHEKCYDKGGRFLDYEKGERKEILDSMVHLPGKKGDIVIFDDRGWHGPNQPNKKRRTVLEFDFTNSTHLGRWQAIGLQMPVSDVSGLSERQLRVLGKDATPLFDPYGYKIASFNRNPYYKFIGCLVDFAYWFQHLKYRVKHIFKMDKLI